MSVRLPGSSKECNWLCTSGTCYSHASPADPTHALFKPLWTPCKFILHFCTFLFCSRREVDQIWSYVEVVITRRWTFRFISPFLSFTLVEFSIRISLSLFGRFVSEWTRSNDASNSSSNKTLWSRVAWHPETISNGNFWTGIRTVTRVE